MQKRERRRQDLLRMKAKAKRIANRYSSVWTQANFDKLYDHLAHCSLRCCGNPRRWEKAERALTMQERRAFVADGGED